MFLATVKGEPKIPDMTPNATEENGSPSNSLLAWARIRLDDLTWKIPPKHRGDLSTTQVS